MGAWPMTDPRRPDAWDCLQALLSLRARACSVFRSEVSTFIHTHIHTSKPVCVRKYRAVSGRSESTCRTPRCLGPAGWPGLGRPGQGRGRAEAGQRLAEITTTSEPASVVPGDRSLGVARRHLAHSHTPQRGILITTSRSWMCNSVALASGVRSAPVRPVYLCFIYLTSENTPTSSHPSHVVVTSWRRTPGRPAVTMGTMQPPLTSLHLIVCLQQFLGHTPHLLGPLCTRGATS